MFSNVAIFVMSTLAAVAIAGGNDGISGSCNTGTVQCCNSVQDHTDASRSFATSFMQATAGDVTGQYGSTCSPSTILGAGAGSDCNNQPTCCTGNSYNGLIVLGCSPINIGL